jgi:hypothetical protein
MSFVPNLKVLVVDDAQPQLNADFCDTKFFGVEKVTVINVAACLEIRTAEYEKGAMRPINPSGLCRVRLPSPGEQAMPKSAHNRRHKLFEPHEVIIGMPKLDAEKLKSRGPPGHEWIAIHARQMCNDCRGDHSRFLRISLEELGKELAVIKDDVVIANDDPIGFLTPGERLLKRPICSAKIASIDWRFQQFDVTESRREGPELLG